MNDFCSALVARLKPNVAEQLRAFAHGQSFGIASVCSGTDSSTLAFQSVARALRHDLLADCSCHTLFAAELSPEKRRFLKAVYPSLPKLFGDLTKLTQPQCKNFMTGRFDAAGGTDWLFGGFPCQDASSLSTAAASTANKQCIANNSLRTGSCFAGIIEYIELHRVPFVVLENVVGLRGANLESAMMRLHTAGYIVRVYWLNAMSFGAPQQRPRLWFACTYMPWLAQQVGQDSLSEEAQSRFAGHLDELVQSFMGHEVMNLDMFLLPESDHEVVSLLQGLRSRVDPGRLHQVNSGDKWVGKHLDKFVSRLRGRQWWQVDERVGMVSLYPGLLELLPREVDVLELNQVRVPDLQTPALTIDVSQTADRTRTSLGVLPCITPTCRIWLAHQGRLLRGIEAIWCQGIFFELEEVARSFGSTLLLNLAGNAFHTFCCSACIMALLSAVACFEAG